MSRREDKLREALVGRWGRAPFLETLAGPVVQAWTALVIIEEKLSMQYESFSYLHSVLSYLRVFAVRSIHQPWYQVMHCVSNVCRFPPYRLRGSGI